MSPSCLRCGLRITSDLVNWQRITEYGTLVGYTCPRCQRAQPTHSPEGARP